MTGNITKVRSLLLTALMVISGVAGATAFAGSAATADVEVGVDSPIFQGQDAKATGFANDSDVTLEKKVDGNWIYQDQYTADENSTIVDTSDLEGQFQLDDGSSTASFQVVEQTLDMSTDATEVKNAGSDSKIMFTLENSNRNNFDVHATSEEAFGEDVGTFSDDGDEATLDFTDVDAGTYNVTLSVSDSDASETFEVTVTDAGDISADFEESSYSVPRGDIVPITVDLDNTDSATVQVGSNESNFNISADVTDGSGDADDGKVTFYLNTYKTTDNDADNVIYAGAESGDSVDATWVTDSLDEPVAVTSGDNIYQLRVDADADGTPENAAALNVNGRNTGSAQTWIAPANLDADNPTDLMDAVTQRSSVAHGDYVVVQIKDTTGIYGAVSDASDLSSVNGLSMTVTENDPEPNTKADSFDTTNSGVKMIDDGANESLYLLVETDAVNGIDKDDLMGEWTAEFTVDSDYAVTPDDDQSVSTTFSVEEPTIEVNDGNDVSAAPSDNQSVSGTTNFAPGTSVRMQVSSGVFFKNLNDLTVGEDGSFEGMMDFSEYENDTEFTVKAIANGQSSSVEGVLNQNAQEDPETTTTTTMTTTTTTTSEATSSTTSTSDEPTDTTTTTTTSNNDGQPGFGVAISVVALLAAALLALRREN
ncbi:BGTF surface domain-containing protein [Haladaptatus sp. DFWS20]|uniref:DUF7827 domain-containing protein n=1 Tax=Haladaptatus sp. DFWS20 TaxID=3403467 RepID=UPI003EBFE0F2